MNYDGRVPKVWLVQNNNGMTKVEGALWTDKISLADNRSMARFLDVVKSSWRSMFMDGLGTIMLRYPIEKDYYSEVEWNGVNVMVKGTVTSWEDGIVRFDLSCMTSAEWYATEEARFYLARKSKWDNEHKPKG